MTHYVVALAVLVALVSAGPVSSVAVQNGTVLTAKVLAQARTNLQSYPAYTGKWCTLNQDFGKSQQLKYFDIDYAADHVQFRDGRLMLKMDQQSGTRISSTSKYRTVHAEAKLYISSRSGVVSTFILRSEKDNGDEVDFEWVGKEPLGGQTNYFTAAKQQDYSHSTRFWNYGAQRSESYDGSRVSLTVGIEYNDLYTKWYRNGQLIRTLNNSRGVPFDNKPMFIQLGIWDGSKTSGWAGTVDYSKAPFYVQVEQINIYTAC